MSMHSFWHVLCSTCAADAADADDKEEDYNLARRSRNHLSRLQSWAEAHPDDVDAWALAAEACANEQAWCADIVFLVCSLVLCSVLFSSVLLCFCLVLCSVSVSSHGWFRLREAAPLANVPCKNGVGKD
jgi:hypothetical protein